MDDGKQRQADRGDAGASRWSVPSVSVGALFSDAGLERVGESGRLDERCRGLTDDSRAAVAGGVFVARGPWSQRLATFTADAVSAGVSAVVLPAEAPREGWGEAAVFVAERTDQALAGRLADRFYGKPAASLKLVGVTGTNGKTTVAMITQHLLNASGLKAGLLGTVWTDVGDASGPTPATLTTPGAIELRDHLAAMVGHGCVAVVMEVSSHALDQGRVAGVGFDAAVFTNLTQDHLDYHGTMARYAAAKAELFSMLKPTGVAIVNGQDPAAATMVAGVSPDRVLRTAVRDAAQGASVWPEAMDTAGSRARFDGPWGQAKVALPLVGGHNLQNALQAACAAHVVEPMTADALGERLSLCPPVPGRLEPVVVPGVVPGVEGPRVLVDYAHTPDALERVGLALHELRRDEGGRLIVVYGCGGDRDRAKRPLMTEAALRFADVAVLTSDNPRSEDPLQILADAQEGVSSAALAKLRVTVDRAAAIQEAIALAEPGDTVLIAGKGHEDYQVVAEIEGVFGQGTRRVRFDDREQAAAALAERGT